MAKFAIECPKCGKYAEASTGFFARKKIDCSCGNVIDVRTDSISSKNCPHCGNSVVYDQREGAEALCPICKNALNTSEDNTRISRFSCPQCGCGLSADKAAETYICPVCDKEIIVQQELQLEKIAKTGFASVIKYEGDNKTFVWKHPIEDFNIGSQLIVHESQEAIFFRDGQALDLFPAGRWSLETASIPLVNRLHNLMLEPSSVFHSEVYFVNLTTQMGIKWGTDSKVRFLDPVTGIPLDIGASGSFNIRVNDSRKLLLKLVGTEGVLDRKALLSTKSDEPADSKTGSTLTLAVSNYFRSMIMTRVKTLIAKTIKENAINILEIDEHLDALSDALRQRINEGLAEYGLTLPEFFVTTVVTPDDDKNFQELKKQHANRYLRVQDEKILQTIREAEAERRAVEERTKAQMKIIEAQGGAEVRKISAHADAEAYRMQAEAEALEMKMKGYTYAQETQRQVGLEAMKGGIIKEGGAGGGLGDLVGLGVGLGAIGSVVGIARDAIKPITDSSANIGQTVSSVVAPSFGWDCSCGEKGVKGNFCNNCGTKRPEIGQTWNCACGQTGNLKNFCSNCGAKKADTWDCVCGNKG